MPPDQNNDQHSNTRQANNPLHGLTLEHIVRTLFVAYGWDGLAQRVNINCFKSDPSVKSSLKFLRKTPWARTKVEKLYVTLNHTESPWSGGRQK